MRIITMIQSQFVLRYRFLIAFSKRNSTIGSIDIASVEVDAREKTTLDVFEFVIYLFVPHVKLQICIMTTLLDALCWNRTISWTISGELVYYGPCKISLLDIYKKTARDFQYCSPQAQPNHHRTGILCIVHEESDSLQSPLRNNPSQRSFLSTTKYPRWTTPICTDLRAWAKSITFSHSHWTAVIFRRTLMHRLYLLPMAVILIYFH